MSDRNSVNSLPALIREESLKDVLLLIQITHHNLTLRQEKPIYPPAKRSDGLDGSNRYHHVWGKFSAFALAKNECTSNRIKRKSHKNDTELLTL